MVFRGRVLTAAPPRPVCAVKRPQSSEIPIPAAAAAFCRAPLSFLYFARVGQLAGPVEITHVAFSPGAGRG